MAANIFSTLSQFCTSPENYLTEALVYLLKELLSRKPEAGLKIVNQLAHFRPAEVFHDPKHITITTQVTEENGRPDIQITDGKTRLAFIEVKHDSPLHDGQLESYICDLHDSLMAVTNLVLLTRSRQSRLETTLHPNQYHHSCWYEIYNWLTNVKSGDPVCEYLIEQFLNFLEEKSMNLDHVSWQYIDGVPALVTLGKMIEAAIEEAIPGSKPKRTGGWYWRGYYLNNVFIGVRYDHPMVLVFENNKGYMPTFKQDFNFETSHFFAFSKDEQFEKLVSFLIKVNQDYTATGMAELPPTIEVADE